METFYWTVFGGLLAAVIALQLSNRSADKLQTSDAFKVFKNNYLIVYCLMMGGCGPHIQIFEIIVLACTHIAPLQLLFDRESFLLCCILFHGSW